MLYDELVVVVWMLVVVELLFLLFLVGVMLVVWV